MPRVMLCTLILCLLAGSASAIVIRHDREDAAYRELAGDIDCVCSVGSAMGTLIAPEWVLTAAHVAEPLGRGDAVHLGGRTVEIAEVFLHPDFGYPDTHRDLALVRLASPISDVAPVRLYEGDDEIGQQVIVVGEGQTGDGRQGPSKGPAVMRAGRNVVDAVRLGWLSFVFDAPPDGEDLEGISGPGDSGGPALLRTNSGWAILGVSAYNDGTPPCTYGTVEHYCRISDNLTWIRGTMSGEIKPSREPSVMVHGTDAQGRTTVAREPVIPVELDVEGRQEAEGLVLKLASALNESDRDAYLATFNRQCIERRVQAGDPVDGMFNFFEGVRKARGAIIGFHALPTEGVLIPDSEFPMYPIVFHLADGTPGYFGLAMDTIGLIDHLSLFIQSSICDGGASCDAVDLHLKD